ncbi:PEP-CTERM sorting domain-containing protein [Roseibacillus ishigakijimensis]|uniref:PEP-CTERM sorting domain-containing protein n=1 Tax=Roseibacillus ishigakijimensis TaxID=454146 RepID=A0A934RT14_9BACT|nr:PEP-CTERM sorting domain-containing protein [Roseibacillus ishigakijimensis]MBK1835121.1 PEP-CTERM sorting domain-containing protein [Roseibacillus ishigakijimensis]
MKTSLRSFYSGNPLLLLCSLSTMAHSQNAIWDTAETAEVTVSTGSSNSLFVQSADILGGERDMYIEILAGGISAGNNMWTRTDAEPLRLESNAASGSATLAIWTWDGEDGSTALNPIGLGGVDLANLYSGLLFEFTSDGADNVQWDIVFYSDASNHSTYTIYQPFSLPVSDVTYSPSFSDFAVTAGTGADFSNIGAIEIMTSSPSPAINGAVDSMIRNLQFSPTLVPEPTSSLLMLLAMSGIFYKRKR